jgi:hypothetical protein
MRRFQVRVICEVAAGMKEEVFGHDECEWENVCFERFEFARCRVCAWVNGLAEFEKGVEGV